MALEKSEKCIHCGTAEWEWQENPYAYHPVRHTCPGCRKREILLEDDDDVPKGTTVRLVDQKTALQMERREYELKQRARREREDRNG